jgi:hypothetical protein
MQHIDNRDDEPHAGFTHTQHPTDPEQHPSSYCFTTRTAIAAVINTSTPTAMMTTNHSLLVLLPRIVAV